MFLHSVLLDLDCGTTLGARRTACVRFDHARRRDLDRGFGSAAWLKQLELAHVPRQTRRCFPLFDDLHRAPREAGQFTQQQAEGNEQAEQHQPDHTSP